MRLGCAAVAEGLVEPADAVVRRGDEHEIARRPGVELAVREHAGHAEPRHLLHLVPAEHLPFIGEQRIEPGVVRTIAHGVVVLVRDGLVEVVQHLRLPLDVRVEDVLRELQRQRHRVAIVIVADVMAPVDQATGRLAGMRHMPLERDRPRDRGRPPRRSA